MALRIPLDSVRLRLMVIYMVPYLVAIKPTVPEESAGVRIAFAGDSALQSYHERWLRRDKKHVREMLNRELGVKVELENEL